MPPRRSSRRASPPTSKQPSAPKKSFGFNKRIVVHPEPCSKDCVSPLKKPKRSNQVYCGIEEQSGSEASVPTPTHASAAPLPNHSQMGVAKTRANLENGPLLRADIHEGVRQTSASARPRPKSTSLDDVERQISNFQLNDDQKEDNAVRPTPKRPGVPNLSKEMNEGSICFPNAAGCDFYWLKEQLSDENYTAVYLVKNSDGEYLAMKLFNTKHIPMRPNEKPWVEIDVYDTVQKNKGHENILRKLEHTIYRRNGSKYELVGKHGGYENFWREIEHTQSDDVDFFYAIILEYAEGGNYCDALKKGQFSDLDKLREHFRQIVRGMQCLHQNGFANLDLSPQNILIKDERLVLMDFGAALRTTDRVNGLRGKDSFAAPEVFEAHQRPCDPSKADIWSLGIILATMMMHGNVPFKNANDDRGFLHFKSQQNFGDALEECIVEHWDMRQRFQHGSLNLLKRLLQINPSDRPSLDDILEHEYCDF